MLGLTALLLSAVAIALAPSPHVKAQEGLVFQTQAGPLHLTLLGHGSLMMEFQGKIIYVDPYTQVAKYDRLPKADQIWITHEHYDHLDMAAIDAVRKPDTVFIADALSAARLQGNVNMLKNGDSIKIDGISLLALPAYNVVRERAPGQKYHPQGNGNGYLANFGGLRLYIAGDTEAISEMAQLQNIDVALLPVMLPYTMSIDEAATAARSFAPKLVLPYHASKNDAKALVAKLQGSGIEAKLALP